MAKLFDNKCRRCGFSEDPKTGKIEPELFDFHHRDPSKKEFEIGQKLKCNIDRCIEEAKKCDLLCANCHRVIEDELRAKKLNKLYDKGDNPYYVRLAIQLKKEEAKPKIDIPFGILDKVKKKTNLFYKQAVERNRRGRAKLAKTKDYLRGDSKDKR